MTVAGKTGTQHPTTCGVTFAGMTGYYAGAVWIGSDNYKPLEFQRHRRQRGRAAVGGDHDGRCIEPTGCTTDRDIICRLAVGLRSGSL